MAITVATGAATEFATDSATHTPQLGIMIALIEFEHVVKRYGGRAVIPDFSLTIAAGEFNVILGPPGSGKSTLMRMLCGAEGIDGGAIRIDGRDVAGLTPRQRGCALVSQSDALYPNLTVSQNIEQSLKLAGLSKPERAKMMADLARTLRLDGLLERRPDALTPGERLRVAIARASAGRPRVLLFDEPWSDVDARQRMELQFELATLRWRLDATLLLVTRDQGAAMALADRIVVINRGDIEQIGSPRRILGQPSSPFVAGYIGQPPMNLLIVGVAQDGLQLRGKPDVRLPDPLSRAIAARQADRPDEDFLLGIRPEKVQLGTESGLTALVLRTELIDGQRVVHLDLSGQHLAAITTREESYLPGSQITANLPAEACHVFLSPGAAAPRSTAALELA